MDMFRNGILSVEFRACVRSVFQQPRWHGRLAIFAVGLVIAAWSVADQCWAQPWLPSASDPPEPAGTVQTAYSDYSPEHLPSPVQPPTRVRRLPDTACDDEAVCPPGGYPTHPPHYAVRPRRKIHHVYVQEPCDEPEPAQQQPAQQQIPPGAFVSPQPSGAVVEEARSLEIRGLRLNFPAMSLGLPSIELPFCVRRQRAARMELDAATAPYVAGAGYSRVAAPQTVPTSMARQAAAAQPAGAQQQPQPARDCGSSQHAKPDASLDNELDALHQRCRRLEQLLERLIQCQTNPPGFGGYPRTSGDLAVPSASVAPRHDGRFPPVPGSSDRHAAYETELIRR